MKNLIIVGEDVSKLTFNSFEELNDKIESLPLAARRHLPKSKSLGAASSIMAGAYESAVAIQNGDSTPVVYNTMAGVIAAAQVAAGVTARIWEMTVPIRYFYAWGSGAYAQINNQGYMFFFLMKAGTGFHSGKLMLSVETYDRHRKVPVRETLDAVTHLADFTSQATATPTNNQARMLALPQTTVIAQPFSRLVLDYTVLAATAGLDQGNFSIPVTVKSI
jgi:hypothetical protein